jgi:hypothetical protein
MNVIKNVIAIIILIVSGLSCIDNPPQPNTGVDTRLVTVSDVGVTEAWLKVDLKKAAAYTYDSLIIKRDDRQEILLAWSRFSQKLIPDPDSVIILDTAGLLPNHPYIYSVSKGMKVNDGVVFYVDKVHVNTMDTTNHNFTWQIDTLGDGQSSHLLDVSIINDTLAYAVGEVYVRDSIGQYNVDPFNFLTWNGKLWLMQSITYVPLGAVFAFSNHDIWVGSSAPYHNDGVSWHTYNVTGIFNGYINKIWGTNSSNVYIVGTNGSIAYFNGTIWQKQESGTNIDLMDVWGSPDGNIVWACGYNSNNYGTCLLKNEKNLGWTMVYDGTSARSKFRSDSLSGALASIYAPTSQSLLLSSPVGVYSMRSDTHGEGTRLSFTPSYFPGFPNCIRGNGPNDWIVVGDYSMLAHYNGATWKYFAELRQNNDQINAVSFHGNLVVGVGVIVDPVNSRGIVFIGRR